MTTRIIAIDWSGNEARSGDRIWLADIDVAHQKFTRLERNRDRNAVIEYVREAAAHSHELVVGIDFAFSLPEWFLQASGLEDAPQLWDLVTREGERWLHECLPPFWGRPGKARPHEEAGKDQLRRTDRELTPVGGIRPKSVFQIGGAGAVGTGSLRGMPFLAELRRAGFSIWPFDRPAYPLVVEIYPRTLTGPVNKSNNAVRLGYLEQHFPKLSAELRAHAAETEDGFDALVAALVMAHHAAEFSALPAVDDMAIRREGKIWTPLPSTSPMRTVSRFSDVWKRDTEGGRSRRQFDSSKTRVAPVLDALREREVLAPDWISKLLDLASGGMPDATTRSSPWHAMDLAVSEHHWAPKERGLQPPVALLSWLIRNFREPVTGLKGRPAIVAERRKLAAGDPATVQKGIEQLRAGKRGWHVLEGPTYPDAFIVTNDALIVIEGKRTEAGPTTSTSLMAGGHQMLRHLDAAWEIRGRRAVYGMFIVEGDPADGGIPAVWQAAARDAIAPASLASSLPHRGEDERRAIGESFVGVTTWQRIVEACGLNMSLVDDVIAPTAVLA